MSRSPERLCIGFAANRVLCLRTRGWLRRRIIDKEALPLAEVAARANPHAWSDALAELETYLKGGRNKKTPVSVVLSNRLVRYVALPWHRAVVTRSERLAQARHSFKQIYGDIAQSWSIECSVPRFERPTLASAIDSALLQGLQRIATENGCVLASIQPYLTASYGHFWGSVRPTAAKAEILCVVEPDQIACLGLDAGAPREVFNQHAHQDWERELQAILLQTSIDRSRTGKLDVRVFAPEAPAAKAIDDAHLTRVLPAFPAGLSAATDAAFAMATLAAA